MSASVTHAENTQLDLFQYFQGECQAWGVFEDRFGRLRRYFQVSIEGVVDSSGDEPRLTLTEDFRFDDGERSQRVWRIRQLAEQHYEGEAEDLLGKAQGEVQGNCLSWRYHMRLTIGKRQYTVKFDDRMYLLPEQVLVNRARVSKWGLTLGTVSIFFQPLAT